GYAQYEISAYARPGRQCAHNLNYWRFGDYLGIGAGAHGKISSGAEQSILRRWKVKHPSDYLLKAGTPQMIGGDELIDDARRPFDYMLNALRLAEGFSLRAFESRTGLPRSAIDIPLARALENDWLTLEGEDVMPTERGHRFNNDVIGLFLGA
ncbi:MAG: oxygen-independent coproporphyrinogen III oxidase-like protein, partial [Luteimonas sp.]